MKTIAIAAYISASVTIAVADVFYVEEIVNKGLGFKKTGVRKTTNKVYIKGQRQRVHTQIEATKSVAKALRRKGQTIDGSTILQLDRSNLLKIDHTRQTLTKEKLLPARKTGSGAGSMHIGVAAKVSAVTSADPNRERSFRTRALDDTTRVAGILCRRVAAEMMMRHFKPGTKQVRRVNRYLYQAWVAADFPGYRDLKHFQDIQARKTSYPSLTRGGISVQSQEAIADYESLREKIDAFEGFHMQSVLKVFSKQGKEKEKQVFELARTVKSISQISLPDSLFDVSSKLTRAQ